MQMWFIFSLISITAVAFAEIGQKLSVSSKKNFSAESINFFVATTQLIFSVLYFLIFEGEVGLNLDLKQFLLIVISGFLGFFFFKFLYTSYKGNSVSISQVIYSSSVFVSTILGVIFFQESVTAFKILGIILIVAAVVYVSFNKGEKFSKYNLLALLSALIYGCLTTIDKSLSIDINIHLYQIFSVFSFMVFSVILAPRTLQKDIKQIDLPTIKTVLISAVGFTIFNKLTYLAYSVGGEVGKVDAINNTSIFLIIILEILLLREKSNLIKKVIGSILAVAGVLILGLTV